ncbi:hypothetical protein UPYG_G00336780 [Umbra pygmaea]|uniref:NR LBD domain-containing protein n=1 Tax=Umbra pygmaea TaxID=75934 RepID=A0ABD0W0E9_UMBPY
MSRSNQKQPKQRRTILFDILNCTDSNKCKQISNGHVNQYKYNTIMSNQCNFEPCRVVYLEKPEGTCQVVSNILVKTIHFMKSLPSFRRLPVEDQLSLLKGCWVPLLSLGMAQGQTLFEVKDVPQEASILRRILLNCQGSWKKEDEGNRSLPTLSGVHKLRTCLNRLWALDLSPKEYAYLKRALLFNPDVPGLSSVELIDSLQREAQRSLHHVVLTLHPGDLSRFSHILISASALQTVSTSLITELFFRPFIGQVDLFHLLGEMLFNRLEYTADHICV